MNLKKNNGKFLASLFFLLISFCTSFAAENKITVRTELNPKEVEVGDIFLVNIEVAANEMVDVDPPQIPTIDGAQFQGQGTSQRTNAGATMNEKGEMVFRRTMTQIFTFQYIAQKDGDLVIPSVVVKAGDQNYKSPVDHLKVYGKGSGRAKGSRVGQNGGSRSARPDFFDEDEDPFAADPFSNIQKMEERFNKLLQRQFGGGAMGFQAVPPFNEKDAFVVVAEVDKTDAYKGEQITASWYLYTKAGVREIDTLKYPDLKGFWKEDIELATLLNFQPAQLNGQDYNKALLASYALFPIEEGKATIDGYKAKVTVVSGMGKGITSAKTSQVIPILVKPLPEAGKPANFSGAVGEYTLQAKVDSTSVVAHQPFSLHVHVEGRGNAKQFELPNPQLPNSVEIYDIKKDSQFFKNGTSLKDFEILLIPRQEGVITIPPIMTSVFNPRTQKYEELSTPEFKLTVLPGTGQQGLQSSRLQKSGEPEKLEELNLLTEFSKQNENPQVNIFLMMSLFVLSFAGLFAFAAYELRWFRKPLGLKEKFQIRHKKLEKILAQKKWRELGAEATNISSFILGEISGQGGANLPTEKLIEKAPPSVRRDLGAELKKTTDKFYILGFGPEEAVQKAAQDTLLEQEVKNLEKLLIKAIELSSSDMKV